MQSFLVSAARGKHEDSRALARVAVELMFQDFLPSLSAICMFSFALFGSGTFFKIFAQTDLLSHQWLKLTSLPRKLIAHFYV